MSERESKRSKVDSEVANNPYLAHLNPDSQAPAASSSGGPAPFDGWIPRKVTGKQVEAAMVSTLFLLPTPD